ncbi:GNAT family N-acetyltransferase [Paracraurococcus lichenis]|uniref:GNAT family N-acetyltransferase n=1 Tax=Paracraurococcus lichenis TaxID=3064888 RepID=A0ABT9DYM5_9PROT|nr:GNAT family N-acetyltransferase [Paracraurococcus sp. LOR1-02]MDO9709012.1 GNAT family N-acetyltransferase [Paracraurococcus sp. LOR1-02]
MIRPGRDEDAEGFIALIGACWAEYPGCVMDVDGEVPELRALATYYAQAGGALWAAEREGRVVGMVATRPLEPGAWEICKMYVAAAERGSGLAAALLDGAEAHARVAGAGRLVLWSDTRFDRAHRFYEKRSFVRQGPIRVLDDLSHSLEFRYAKPLRGIEVEVLDAAGAASAERRLAEMLVACVAGGAELGFLAPLAMDKARAYWKGVAKDVATGRMLLLGGWRDGLLAGTVQLGLAMPETQAHRADVWKLLVDPAARRAGLGRALIGRAEEEARRLGRRLLVLDTLAGGAAEPLYRALGWTEAGAIPGFTLDAEGAEQATVLFWKRIRPPGARAA